MSVIILLIFITLRLFMFDVCINRTVRIFKIHLMTLKMQSQAKEFVLWRGSRGWWGWGEPCGLWASLPLCWDRFP